MGRWIFIALLALLLIGGGYFTARVKSGVFVWREKMEITLRTPTGVLTGSTVRQVRFGANNLLDALFGMSPVMRVSGEAVGIDLGSKGAFFVLIGNDEPNLYRVLHGEVDDIFDIRWKLWRPGLRRTLTSDSYPKLALFSDPLDPQTAKRLTRLSMPNILGQGYAIEKIVLTRTYAPVTKGAVGKLLPWMLDDDLFRPPNWRALKRTNNFLRHAINGIWPNRPVPE